MNTDLAFTFLWWLLLFLIGAAGIPLSHLLFKRFIDIGYGFAKTIGLISVTFVAFILATLRIAPLTSMTLYLILFAYLVVNIYLFKRRKQKITAFVLKNLKVLVAQEILFTTGLFFWSLIRSYHPDINGLEKFMDFGFINSTLRSTYLPPSDMWFAGNSINYYWFGHLFTGVATKLSNIPSSITYNLMIATILGFTLTSTFSIVATLVKNLNFKKDIRIAYAAGIISVILLTFAGNLHAPIYILKDGPKNYWYPDATRFIGYNPETNDKTIHEFPLYSFVVSDLHPHLMNLPFVLLYIALLLNYVVNTKPKPKLLHSKSGYRNQKQLKKFDFRILKLIGNWKLETGNSQNKTNELPFLISLGFILGVMVMTNTWDFANYLLVTIVVLGLFNLKNKKLSFKTLLKTAKVLLVIVIIALVTALPFIINFDSLAQGVDFVKARSALWQLGVLWGFPAILTTIFAIFLFKFRSKLKRSDLFILSLLISSWILITIPEIVYVKDIYIGSHHRANTMFKLTYAAYVMFYLSSGYIAVRTLVFIKSTRVKVLSAVFYTLLFASILSYASFATSSFYGELKTYKGLSGESWLREKHPGEYAAIVWLRENVSGQPVILEAPGDSYTEFNVISSYTGLPTVSGWFVHEWLWRGDSSFPQERVADINLVYTSDDLAITRGMLDKYQVEYIIVGTFEREKYPDLNEEKFAQLGTQVFSSGNTIIYQMDN